MVGYRAVPAAILGVVFAACGTGIVPTPPAAPSLTATSGVATTTLAPSPTETTAPGTAGQSSPSNPPHPPESSPSPTPIPVPPKPSGLGFDRPGEGDEWRPSRLTWENPRSEGVEIRVYGVRTCFGADRNGQLIDGACLRTHTALPDEIRVLLAKAPASKGSVAWGEQETLPEGCAVTFLSDNGTPYYSVVVAAISASGHSNFAIAEPGWYDPDPEICGSGGN